jgi:hypothetical protein
MLMLHVNNKTDIYDFYPKKKRERILRGKEEKETKINLFFSPNAKERQHPAHSKF